MHERLMGEGCMWESTYVKRKAFLPETKQTPLEKVAAEGPHIVSVSKRVRKPFNEWCSLNGKGLQLRENIGLSAAFIGVRHFRLFDFAVH